MKSPKKQQKQEEKQNNDVEMEDAEEEKETEEEDDYIEEDTSQSPQVIAANLTFLLALEDKVLPPDQKRRVKDRLMKHIKEHSMSNFYMYLCSDLGWSDDTKLVKELKNKNEVELKKLKDKVEDAKTNAGETEVREAKLEIANYLSLVGEKQEAVEAFEDARKITVGLGEKIDLEFSIIHLGIMWNDAKLIKEHIEKVQGMVDKGGDWERRNLLGVYRGLYCMSTREFDDSAKLLLDAVATFTCYRLTDYNTFIFYTVLLAMVSQNRVTLRDKVIKAPEILSVIDDIPHLRELVFSLYRCNYKQFFISLALITPTLKRDRYLAPHIGYFLREIRIVAYSQFLKSYSSVTLESMAHSFGTKVEFLDRELSRFISVGRLNCKLDKVGGTIKTTRPDKRNTEYLSLIKHGDQLLNRIQKLTKIINY